MVNSCLTVEYPPVHRSVVVVDTSLLGCGSRSVYVFYTRWDVQWRFWLDCYCTCWLCIVTTGRNKGLSFPVCLKSLCVKCSVAKATAAHPSYPATRWEIVTGNWWVQWAQPFTVAWVEGPGFAWILCFLALFECQAIPTRWPFQPRSDPMNQSRVQESCLRIQINK